MNAFRRTKKLFIASVGVLLVSLGAYGGLFFYTQQTNNEIAEIESGIALEVQREERLRNLKQLLQETQTARAQLDEYFIGTDVVNFIERVEDFGALTGAEITVQNVTVAPVEKGEGVAAETYESLQMNIAAEGDWRSVYHVLQLVEALPYKVKLKQVMLERVSIEQSLWRGTYNFTVAKLK